MCPAQSDVLASDFELSGIRGERGFHDTIDPPAEDAVVGARHADVRLKCCSAGAIPTRQRLAHACVYPGRRPPCRRGSGPSVGLR